MMLAFRQDEVRHAMKVYTYYEDAGAEGYREALEIWTLNWKEAGWTPCIIGPEAIPAARLAAMAERFRSLPTVNDPRYELAGYDRWLAMEAMGGGVWVETDVLNIRLSTNVKIGCEEAECWGNGRNQEAVYSSPAFATRVAEHLLSWNGEPETIGGRPHCSAMTLLAPPNFEWPSYDCRTGTYLASKLSMPLVHVTWVNYHGMGVSRYDALSKVAEEIRRFR